MCYYQVWPLKSKCKNKHDEKRLKKELKNKFTDKESVIEWLNKKKIIDAENAMKSFDSLDSFIMGVSNISLTRR